MQYAKERAAVIARELKGLTATKTYRLRCWKYKEGWWPRPPLNELPGFQDFDSDSMFWSGKDKHYWFHHSLTVPQEFEGQALWLRFFMHTDTCDGRDPQALLFVNGEAYQGIDYNHLLVHLAYVCHAGQEFQLDLQAYTGGFFADCKLHCDLLWCDGDVQDLYYDMQVPLLALDCMPENSRQSLLLADALNETVNLLDLRAPGSEAFKASVQQARAYIGKAVYQDLAGDDSVIASCIGHTHIDVAYWWPVRQTREKVARSFATVLRLMEEYPEYRFMSSQPQLYVFLQERYPELYEKIKQRVQESRWEPEGGMWLEADTNLTSGESLVRQFLYGKRFFKEEFGVDSRILWLPDAFGYSGALPQIMKKCGVDYFMTTKLSWNQTNKIPADTLLWEGIDGSQVLSHFITAKSALQDPAVFRTTYNGYLNPSELAGGWQRYQNKDLNNDILIAYGHGDGGGGPERDMLEIGRRMEKGLAGIPMAKQVFAREYFDKLRDEVMDNKRLPVWVGEFYFEYHRGTLTSMARNKRGNRKCEFALQQLEWLAVLAEKQGHPYPTEELERMWKLVLLNQFHDILPGSAIEEVYEQTAVEYADVLATCTTLSHSAASLLAGGGDGITVYNPAGEAYSGLVALPRGICALAYETGEPLPGQTLCGKHYAFVEGIPAKGWQSFAPAQAPAPTAGCFTVSTTNGTHRLHTPYYRVCISADGRITSLVDSQNGRELVAQGDSFNRLVVYEDKPMAHDNWDIDCYYTEKAFEVQGEAVAGWACSDGLFVELQLEHHYSKSVIRQSIRFYAHSRRIDFNTWANWQEEQHLLRALFPTTLHADEATFDIQFGNLTRKTHTNTSWDKARFESCAQKWVDVSEAGYGISLLNDCKYGHSVRRGELGLTLIKSGNSPNPHADREEHTFTYALLPHSGGWRDADTQKEAIMLNQPPFALAGGRPGEGFCTAAMQGKGVLLETIKRSENGKGMVLRIHESHGARTRASVLLASPPKAITECDLLENPLGEISFEGSSFAFEILPYEIKSFRID